MITILYYNFILCPPGKSSPLAVTGQQVTMVQGRNGQLSGQEGKGNSGKVGPVWGSQEGSGFRNRIQETAPPGLNAKQTETSKGSSSSIDKSVGMNSQMMTKNNVRNGSVDRTCM